MYVTKPYKFIGFGAMDVTNPREFIGFGAMDVTKPYEFIGFGAPAKGPPILCDLWASIRSARGPPGPMPAGPLGPLARAATGGLRAAIATGVCEISAHRNPMNL